MELSRLRSILAPSPTGIDALHTVDDFRRAAKRKLPRMVWDFVDGGADGELALAAITRDAGRLGRGHVPADCLSVNTRQPSDRPGAFPGQPQTQNLSYLKHTNLPERHRRFPNCRRRNSGDCTINSTGAGEPRGGPTGAHMVP